MHVHHLCGNKLCVNVCHLELITPQDHRKLHQATNKRPSKLTREAVDDIRNSNEVLTVVADRYGITKSYAAKVRRGTDPEDYRLDQPLPAYHRGRSAPPLQRTRLSDEDIAYIRTSGASMFVLSQMFGMSPGYMSQVRSGKMPKQ